MAPSSKARRKALKNIPRKAVPTPSIPVTNVPTFRSIDITTSPGEVSQASVEDLRWGRLGTRTDVPEIGIEEHQDTSVIKSSYVESWPALIDKHIAQKVLFSKRNITALLVIAWGAIGTFFTYYDNVGGKLDDLDGLKWLGVKFGVVTVVFVLVIVVVWLVLQTPTKDEQ